MTASPPIGPQPQSIARPAFPHTEPAERRTGHLRADLSDGQQPTEVFISAVEDVTPDPPCDCVSHVPVPPTMTGVQLSVVQRRSDDDGYTRTPVARMVVRSAVIIGLAHTPPTEQPSGQPGADRSDSQADGASSILITRSTRVIAGGSRPLRGPVSSILAPKHTAMDCSSPLCGALQGRPTKDVGPG